MNSSSKESEATGLQDPKTTAQDRNSTGQSQSRQSVSSVVGDIDTCLIGSSQSENSRTLSDRGGTHIDNKKTDSFLAKTPGHGKVPGTIESMTNEQFLTLVGSRVRQHRDEINMSRKLLAKQSGVSERYLAQLESGRGNISISLLRKVANAIGVRMEQLMEEIPSENPN